MKWLKNLFKLPEPKEIPEPGQRWGFTPVDGSPWASEAYEPVRILDVEQGWVRYAFGKEGTTFLQDERMNLYSFTRLYKRVD